MNSCIQVSIYKNYVILRYIDKNNTVMKDIQVTIHNPREAVDEIYYWNWSNLNKLTKKNITMCVHDYTDKEWDVKTNALKKKRFTLT